MAPEVILTDPEAGNKSASYDSKADIWSIGITAIEIAEKNPPLADIHPMRALVLIPTSNLGLAKPKSWTRPFQEFISLCLTKDPNERPSAAECLKHPFIARAEGLNRTRMIADIVVKVRTIREKKKAGIDVEDDEDADDDSRASAIPIKAISETIKLAEMRKKEEDDMRMRQEQNQPMIPANTSSPALVSFYS
jgi:serine/threonine protein kinase